MGKIRSCLASFFLTSVLFLPVAFAGSAPAKEELEMMSKRAVDLEVFEDIMEMGAKTEEGKKTWAAHTKEEREKRQFCRGFLADVRAQRDIEIIEPLYQTDKSDDSKLQEFLKKCPSLELFLSVYPAQPDFKDPETWKRFTYEEKRKLGRVFTWTTGFRVYEIPERNRPYYALRVAGGYETYKYTDSIVFRKHRAKEAASPPKPITSTVDYRIFTLDTCEDYDWIFVMGEWDYRKDMARNCSNGILTYKGNFYVYETCDEPGYGRNIRLIDLTIRKKRERDTSYPYDHACSLSGRENK